MIFSSYQFIFIFFPIVVAVFMLLRKFCGIKACKIWLVLSSVFFYSQGNILFLPLLVGTVIFNYVIIYFIDKDKKRGFKAKLFLTLGVLENLGLLFYFKYTNFFLYNVNMVFGTDYIFKNIILPIGISFYTFQILAYVIDVYREESEKSSLLDFFVFITFFPQLIVGPIMRHDQMIVQLEDEKFKKLDKRNIMLGILLFSIGCSKKILLADPLITHAQNFYNVMGTGNFFESWGGVISYTFAYYFDFSGYIDMALGLGLFFNIKLPQNFNSPYKARNFADFWRRWNMTVTQFFNDYIFRNIFKFGNRLPKLILATIITFIVSGVWHGAGWHYIFWGIANGILVCIANIMTLKDKKLPFFPAWLLTFFFVLLTRVLFDSNNMTQAITVYQNLFDIQLLFTDATAFLAQGIEYFKANIPITIVTIISACICFFTPNTSEIANNYKPKWYHPVYCGVLMTASLFFMGTVSNFLYFQF